MDHSKEFIEGMKHYEARDFDFSRSVALCIFQEMKLIKEGFVGDLQDRLRPVSLEDRYRFANGGESIALIRFVRNCQEVLNKTPEEERRVLDEMFAALPKVEK